MPPSNLELLKKEFQKKSKTANARITSLKKGRYRSPAVQKLKEQGIKKFGIKAQKLETEADFKKALRQVDNFLKSDTSTRRGIKGGPKGVKAVTKEMMRNFGIEKKGGESWSSVTRKAKKLFNLYDDLKELQNKGELKQSDKYELIEMMSQMYDDGLIDSSTSAAELINSLNIKIEQKKTISAKRQSTLNFQWLV